MKHQHYSPARVIVAVSGTIQCGFELRSNIDFTDRSNNNTNEDDNAEGGQEETVKAIFLGYAVVRGVKMYFDIKDTMAREYDPETPHRVNPAMVLTGDRFDANQYALYLVDERACLQALLGEPRMLTMAPDAVRIELDDKDTSPEVSALARAIIRKDGKSNINQCAVMAVVSCYTLSTFMAAPAKEIREDGTHLTSFRESLQKFANIKNDEDSVSPGSEEWNRHVAQALWKARTTTTNLTADYDQQQKTYSATDNAEGITSGPHDKDLYGTDKNCSRISQRMTVEEFNVIAAEAGLKMRAA
mmetsp:Transcript_15324/g.21352  ORF Transcript_15324/g.21352 Transcript_15324/m.21352 type:complete len:301 (+) Transcript_15324:206-1108(+)